MVSIVLLIRYLKLCKRRDCTREMQFVDEGEPFVRFLV